jgi:hypothetical protein
VDVDDVEDYEAPPVEDDDTEDVDDDEYDDPEDTEQVRELKVRFDLLINLSALWRLITMALGSTKVLAQLNAHAAAWCPI